MHFSNYVSGKAFCNYVNSPTRGQHLLDLVLSDLADCVYCQVLPPIADYNPVFTELSVIYEIVANQSRLVFDYKSANWRGLRHFLANKNWKFFGTLAPNEAAIYLR